MAPRTRGRAHQPTVPSRRAASFADLPDEVLVRCLGLLDLRERQRAALVCKRFAAAACSPELLQEVDVGEVKEVAALHSLSAWLARRGRHMQRLLLSAQPHSLPAGPDSFEAALTGCLHAAASSAARLVRLTAGRMVTSTGWLAGLPSLQQLELQGSVWSTPLHLSPAISGLAALGSLHLDGMIIIDHGLRLPTTITQLHLASHHSLDMPAQFVQLPRLAELELEDCAYTGDSMAPLSRLAGSLTLVRLADCCLPDSLHQLSRLQHLNLWECFADEGDTRSMINDALEHLTQLTFLGLFASELPLPPAVAGLRRLQRCYLCIRSPTLPLPAGPWLASLRWLGVCLSNLANSTTVLRHAAALEFVELIGDGELEWRSPAAAQLLDWLAQHPPLRTVTCDQWCGTGDPTPSAFDVSLAGLRARRPGLAVHVLLPHQGGNYHEAFMSRMERSEG